jgi:hypothetical protein
METATDVQVADKEMMAVLMGEKSVEAALNLEASSPTQPATEATPTTPDPPTAEAGAKDDAAADPKAGRQADPATAPEPVVMAKDGKHTIPYSVIEGLRDRVQQQAAQIAELQKGNPEGIGKAMAPANAKISAEDMELIREEFPEVAKLLEEQNAKLVELRSHFERQAEDARMAASRSAQEAIDAIPKLAHIQANDPSLFAEAVRIDEMLRGRPENANLSLQDRFQKALDAVEIMFGKVSLPGGAPGTPTTEPAAGKVIHPPKQPPGPPIPNSLSDIPAGSPHEHDHLSALASKSDMGRIDHFIGKSPAEIEEIMSRLI